MAIRSIAMILAGFLWTGQALAQDITPFPALEHVQTGGEDIRLSVLSSRNDMVSGGDALVQAALSAPAIGEVVLSVNGQVAPNSVIKASVDRRTFRALIGNLKLGANMIEAWDLGRPNEAPARLIVTNHPLAGPVFSGPKEIPFVCMTDRFKLPVIGGTLGPPLDADCSTKPRINYIYRSTAGTFKPLTDVRHHPADLATTTTHDGVVAPYIVRLETGTADRAIFQFALLHDPASEPEPEYFTPPRAWNGAVIYKFGGGCTSGNHVQGDDTGGVIDDYMLSLGYVEASSTLNVYANNCDDLLAAEAMMMVKERLIERLGPALFTIGWGCSGGSYQAEQIADNYPGLLDGIVIGCSFPDVGHAAVSVHSFGARLLENYFSHAGVGWTDAQKVAVSGLADITALKVQSSRSDRINPHDCNPALPATVRWDATRNPDGVRCGIYEHGATGFGRDAAALARRPIDNVGVQYGLKALNEGLISNAQFLDLNSHIGGVDINVNFIDERTVGDMVALRRGYQTGRFLSGGGGLRRTPVIDYRAYVDFDEGDPHMRFHSFSLQQRLLKANGDRGNLVMLAESNRYGLFSLGSPVLRGALDSMDAWIRAAKRSGATSPQQLAAARPEDLTDACFTREGRRIVEPLVYSGNTTCNRLYPPHGNPYIAAGAPVANDVVKCALKPVDPKDYAAAFRPDEWARLRAVFPQGVCDWTRPGIEQQPLTGTWFSFPAQPS